ncbi:MAG: putative cysteine desulfurase [Candidatus Heimdallarchaeota archaeon LC_3]|nr:MAG: putative cysteine desulfurase [Candidatus Heimdallarchaeota archaeon LC_3]
MFNIDKIRKDFPILDKQVNGRDLVYLDNAATVQKPQLVLDSIIQFYSDYNSNIHRSIHTLSQEASATYEKAREKVKEFINASNINEIIFTSGTTDSINLVANSFSDLYIHKDDEVIITEMEHHSNIVPWQLICDRVGAKLKVIPFNDDGELMLESYNELINNKTKLISIIYVSNVLGTINPVKEIIKIAHMQDITVFVDAAQATPHFSVDVKDLDCDFLAFSGHKMYSGTGIGILYGKEKWLEVMSPYRTGGGMISSVDLTKTTFADLPFKFEAGTPNYVGAVSLGSAIDYINSIGYESIIAHEEKLLAYTVEKIDIFADLTLYGNANKKSGFFSFNLDNIHPYDAGQILDKLGIAVGTGMHCAEPIMKHYGITGTILASFAVYNSIEEIDTLFEGLTKVKQMFG